MAGPVETQQSGPLDCDDDHSPQTPVEALQSREVQVNPATTIVENNNVDDNVPPPPLPPTRKRKLTSEAWNHFTLNTINGVQKAKCNYCGTLLGGETRNGTSHLLNHSKMCLRKMGGQVGIQQPILSTSTLRKRGGQVGIQQPILSTSTLRKRGGQVGIQQPILSTSTLRKRGGQVGIQQPILSTSTSTGSNVDSSSGFDQKLAREAIAKAIILHEYPLAMVEHYGFRMMMNVIQPKFEVVSRNTIKNDILKIYDHERVETMKMLERNKSKIAITTDMWTANNQKRGFMAVTAHFIDDNWALQSRVIRFIYVSCPHNAEVLCDSLMDCMMDWNLDRKLSALTVDNCSTNDSMITLLLNKLDVGTMMLGGALFHMRCSTHILNLIVKDVLEVIGDGVERIRNTVAYWTATAKREKKFLETTRQLKIDCGKKLALDCKTRWSSTYLMLQTALIFKDVFSRLKQRDSQYKCLPLDEDWLLASEICEKLKLFYEAIEVFSGTKYPTANIFFHKICSIRKSLDKWHASNYLIVRDMASSIVEKFDKYWNAIHGIMVVATILDPRFKMKLIEYCFSKLYDRDVAKQKIQEVQNTCFELVSEYQMSTRSMASSSRDSQPHVSKPQSLFDDDVLDIGFMEFLRNSRDASSSTVKSELDYYLTDAVIPPEQNFDILNWWKSNGSKYPTLNRVARDILAVPVSTVASESAFNTGGRFVSPHRKRLHPKTLEVLMCAQNWLWADIKDEVCTSPYRRSTLDDADPLEEQGCMAVE